MAITFKDDAVVQTAIGIGPQGELLGVFAGASNPWDVITEAPQYSHYYQTDGRTWIKTGPGFTITDWTQRVESVFGSFSQYEEDDPISSTISTVYIEKLKLTTPVLVAGTYKLEWGMLLRPDDGGPNSSVFARVQVDDTITLCEAEEQVDDVVFGTDTGSWGSVAGFKQIVLAAGSHFFDVDYRCVNPGGANIRCARLSLFRVA